MKILLLFSVLVTLTVPFQNPMTVNEGSPVTVVSFKCSRARRTVEVREGEAPVPAAAMIPANKTLARNARVNDPPGARDPNADTIDGRSAALEKNVRESRKSQPKTLDGFSYRVKIQNASAKVVAIVIWEYQFVDPSDPSQVVRRQFLCDAMIKENKEKELEGFSLSAPSPVVSVGTLADRSTTPSSEKILINRVEYTDGSVWQRKDWDFVEAKRNYERLRREPWPAGACKGI
jgi:hypothetical protein